MIKVLYGEISSFRDGDQVHQSVHFSDHAASQHPLHTLHALSDSQFLKKKCTISFRRRSQSNIMEFVLKKYHPLVWNFPLQFIFMSLFYHLKYFVIFLGVSVILVFAGCHLVPSPLVCALCQFISCHMKKKWERSDNNRDKGKVEGVDHRITLYNFPFMI